MVLRTDSVIILKINFRLHRAQEIFLPSFCPALLHTKEKLWHTVDVCLPLKFTTQLRSEGQILNASLSSVNGKEDFEILHFQMAEMVLGFLICMLLRYTVFQYQSSLPQNCGSFMGRNSYSSYKKNYKAAPWSSAHATFKMLQTGYPVIIRCCL